MKNPDHKVVAFFVKRDDTRLFVALKTARDQLDMPEEIDFQERAYNYRVLG